MTAQTIDDGFIPETAVQEALRDDLVTLPRVPGEAQWFTLRPESRAEGLRQLGTLEQMYAERQRSIVDAPTILQNVFDEYLQRNYSGADGDDLQRLEAALQVTTWLEPYATGAPLKTGIERRLSIRRLLYPMERLTHGFMGRTTELATLRSFVGVLDPQSRAEAVRRFLSGLAVTKNPPLMLHGIGGVGKSTLLAEFIRQHVNSPVPFPWVYLDFDNPRLNVAILSTLIEEAVEQLRAQYAGSDWAALLAEARQQSNLTAAAHYQSESESRTIAFTDVKRSQDLREQSAESIAKSLAAHVRSAMEGSDLERMMRVSEMLPLLIVMDTFEEVQKRGIEMAGVLWRFLAHLQQEFPRVRVIVSGRAPVPQLATSFGTPLPLTLTEFDESSAISYLMSREVPDYDSARALYRQVGGNPLNLKLAAHIASREKTGKGGIEGIKTTSYLIFAAAENVVQGQLYRRILDRITDEDLQKLAHPGLVVRRVTAKIIQEVLAGPCELGQIDQKRASDLFEKLKTQVDLVVAEPDGALRHQQDVRRVMLKMLETEKPEQVHLIHELAYHFYLSEAGTTAAIEKIYHALQLRKEDSEIYSMWIPEATESMLSSVDELPPSSQLIVFVQAKREPPPELRALASLEQWEHLVESKARQAIEYGDFPQVEKLLAERPDRSPGSALYAIEALASMNTGNYSAARSQLEKGIASAQAVNRIDRLVELWRLLGELNREQGDFTAADEAMGQAQKMAMRMGSALLALQIYASRVNLSTHGAPLPDISELHEILKATSDTDFASARLQLLGLFRLCGEHSIPLLLKGLRVFKLEYLPYLPTPPSWMDEAVKMQSQRRVNEFFQQLLESHPEDTAARTALAGILEGALNPNQSARTA
jgi:tetratricopeptide (TPR) repeat protein